LKDNAEQKMLAKNGASALATTAAEKAKKEYDDAVAL